MQQSLKIKTRNTKGREYRDGGAELSIWGRLVDTESTLALASQVEGGCLAIKRVTYRAIEALGAPRPGLAIAIG